MYDSITNFKLKKILICYNYVKINICIEKEREQK